MLRKLEETEWTLEDRDEQKKLIQKVMQYAIEIPKPWSVPVDHFVQTYIREDDEPIFRPIFEGRAWFLSKDAIKKEGGLYSPLLGFIPPETDDEEFSSIL